MKRNDILFLLAILSGACHSENSGFSKKAQLIEPFPILIDSTKSDGLDLSEAYENATWLTTSQYGIYYIGLKSDTLFLNPFIGSPVPPILEDTNQQNVIAYRTEASHFKKYYIDWLEEVDYPYAEESEIQIRVDSSKSIYNALPVWLTNLDVDTVLIGYGTHIPLVLEAMDSIGTWIPIQEPFVYFCGVGVNSIFLPPNESVITFAPIFKGDFKTKLRLALGAHHSDPFDGFINYRQFESIFNEDGEYKLAYRQELK